MNACKWDDLIALLNQLSHISCYMQLMHELRSKDVIGTVCLRDEA